MLRTKLLLLSVVASLVVAGTLLAIPVSTFAAAPTLTSVEPIQGVQGQREEVVIHGTDFNGARSVSFGPGIMVNSFNVDNTTHLTACITIDSGAAIGVRDVSVVTSGGTVTQSSGYVVVAMPIKGSTSPICQAEGQTAISAFLMGDPPAIEEMDHGSGQPGEKVNIVIRGYNFVDEDSVSFGSGVTVDSLSIDSPTQMTARLTIARDAMPGPRDVSLATNGGAIVVAGGFVVSRPSDSTPFHTWPLAAIGTILASAICVAVTPKVCGGR